MNREVWLRAIRNLLRAERNLAAAGIPLSDMAREQYLREETGNEIGWAEAQQILAAIDTSISARNVMRSAVQGALFNFGDELLGVVDPAGAEEMRLREEMFREAHPFVDGAAGFIGGFATGSLGAAKAGVAGARSLAHLARRGAAAGALSGAAAGVGAGTTLDERLDGAMTGATLGGMLGGVLPPAAHGFRQVFSPAQLARDRALHALRETGDREVAKRVALFRETGRHNDMTLADLGERFRAEADFAIQNNEDVRSRAIPLARERNEAQSQRMLNDVYELLGDDFADASGRLEELRQSRLKWAASDEGYEGLRNRNLQLPFIYSETEGMYAPMQGFDKLFAKPFVRQAWQDAMTEGLVGEFPDLGRPSFAQVHNVKRKLDGMIDKAFAEGPSKNTELGTRLKQVREMLEDEIDLRVPQYRDVNAEYYARMELERGIEEGIEAWRSNDTHALQRAVARMTPDKLHEFRRGLAAQFVQLLGGASTGRDMARVVAQYGPAMQQKLRIAFGHQELFEQYLRRVEVERQMHMLDQAIYGSPTHRRGAAAAVEPSTVVNATLGGPAAVSAYGTAAASGALDKWMRSRVARELGNILLQRGAAADATLADLRRTGRNLPNTLGIGLPVGATSLFDHF